jgi:LuxR family maltose regulon positive regulatory protein
MSITGVPRPTRGIVDRPRVSKILESAAQLVVLHAPSGYGKSVALARWAADTPRHGAWVRLSEGAEGPAGLVQQLADALSASGVVEPTHPFAQAAEALSLESDPWLFFRRGLGSIDRPVTLAIDEAHVLTDESAWGLLGLLAESPDLDVRIATRRSGALTDPAVGLAVDTTLVDSATLRLTEGEAREVLGAHDAPGRLDDVLAHGGAPAVARLVALGADRGSDAVTPWSVRDAADSLLRMRRGAWEPAFLDFLERTSLAGAVSVELAVRLSGDRDAEAQLLRAESEGLGWWMTPVPGAAPLFVYASFFREALERDLRRRTPRETVHRLVVDVARGELRQGRPWPALRRAVECEEWTLATEVVRLHWNDLFRYGAQVRALFRGVSPMTLGRHPLVAVLLAILYNARPESRVRAVEFFLLAAYGARVQRGAASPADRALLNAVDTAAMRVSGRSRAATTTARSAYDALQAMDIRERDRLGRNEPTVWNQIGTSLFYGGDTERALDCFRRSTAASDAKGLAAGLQGLASTAGALAVGGDLPEARVAIAEAERRNWPDGWRDGYPGSLLRLAESLSALEIGEVDAADAAIRRLDPHRPTIEHWAPLAHADTLISLYRGDPEGARLRLEAEVRNQSARHASLRLTEARIRHTLVLAELARGDLGAAESQLAKAPPDVRTAISRARIALAGDDPERAVRLLQDHDDVGGSSRTRAEYLALAAAALALVDADHERVGRMLSRLDALLRDRGQSVALALVPVKGLDAMLHAATGDKALGALVAAIGTARAAGLIAVRASAPRLTPRELAVARELARSDSVASIATALGVSPNTVKTQLRGLYRKLDATSRAEALSMLAAYDLTAHP